MKTADAPKITVPSDLAAALAADPAIQAKWDDITPIGKMDFISWVVQARQEKTRNRRVEVAVDKLRKGQRRPCCFAVIPMELYRALDADEAAKATWKSLTPFGRREFANWVQTPLKSTERDERITQTIALLASGKTHP